QATLGSSPERGAPGSPCLLRRPVEGELPRDAIGLRELCLRLAARRVRPLQAQADDLVRRHGAAGCRTAELDRLRVELAEHRGRPVADDGRRIRAVDAVDVDGNERAELAGLGETGRLVEAARLVARGGFVTRAVDILVG